MAFRTVIISNPAELHACKKQLEICQESTVKVPLDEILLLLLEHPSVRFSAAFLSKMTSLGIAIISCDKRFMPAATALPFSPHSRQSRMAQAQFSMSKPFKKRLWQLIVKAKITNQADVLDLFSKPGAERLREFHREVASGDSSNREAIAARIYFPALFDGHIRSDENVLNDALNYAYSIVRSLIARSLAAYGFYPPLGIHHANEMNAFNLADDLIEPFRPLVDALVFVNQPKGKQLSREDCHRFVQVAHLLCCFGGKSMTVASAIDRMVSSLVEAINSADTTKLVLSALDGVDIAEDIK